MRGSDITPPMSQQLPYLTDNEVNQICDGLKQAAAQVRYLRQMGLIVKTKPNGRPLISRVNFIEVMRGAASGPTSLPAASPNELALRAMFNMRGKQNHGKKA